MHAMLNLAASRMSNLLHLGSVRRLLSANSRGGVADGRTEAKSCGNSVNHLPRA